MMVLLGYAQKMLTKIISVIWSVFMIATHVAANFGHRRWSDMKQNIMKMTNIIIEFLLNSEEENFIDMILTHIRDGIPFDEEEIKEWNDE